jgi:hypothetical protein
VRKAEKLPDNYRLYVTTVQFTITKDETPDEIQAEVFVTEGKIDSVKYLLAWDAEKDEFYRPQMIWRKYANYRLMAEREQHRRKPICYRAGLTNSTLRLQTKK